VKKLFSVPTLTLRDRVISLPVQAQRKLLRRLRRAIIAILTIFLVGSAAFAVGGTINSALNPPERAAWLDKLIDLAERADTAYDKIDETWEDVAPTTWAEVREMVKEIVFQINEEGATTQVIGPTNVTFQMFPQGQRSAVAAYYREDTGEIVLNERFVTPGAWGEWLSTMVHELVHAQGYFVGESSTLEAQTEIIATEVLASMANLGYPGAQAALLDGLRRDALKEAFYIAQFGGAPIHSTYDAPPTRGGILLYDSTSYDPPLPENRADQAMLDKVNAANARIFTTEELARGDHRTRWWMDHAAEYEGVLARYVVKTTTIEIDASCAAGSHDIAEQFQHYVLKQNTNDRGATWTYWSDRPELVTIRMDDLAYVLHNELGFC
jgi:hypothetical protein